ncbi:MAG: O-antigen ligase family protein [Vicinamibacterales bacterium]
MAAYVAAASSSVWAAADRAAAAGHVRAVALGGAAYVLTWLLVRRRGGGRTVALAACVMAGAAAGGYFLTQYRHLASPEVKVAGLDGLGRALSAPFPRLGSWSPFPNSLATLLEGLVAPALGLALARGPAAVRVAAAAAGVVAALALAVSASRGAWLAVAVSLAAFAAHRPLVRWPAAFGAAALAALAAGVAGTVGGGEPWWSRWLDLAGRQDRLDVYLQAASLLREVPFTGLGGGDQFAAAVSHYVLLIQVPFITYAHNFSLQAWLEDGLAGLAAWWALAAALAVAAVAGERAGLGRRFRGLWAGVLAIHVHGLTDARQFVDPWTWAPFFVLAGAVAGFVSRPPCRPPRWAGWAPALVAVVVVAAAVAGRGAPRAAWHTNRGALDQARADAEIAAGGDGAGWRAAAAARFDRAVALAPEDAPSLRRAGILALDQGRYADASRRLGRAWAAEPGHSPTRKAYGLAAVWTGDTALAVELLRGVPGMADELTTWSRWRQQRGETSLALAAARTALALAPDQPELGGWVRQLEAALPDAGAR